jgi:hypothetical protein
VIKGARVRRHSLYRNGYDYKRIPQPEAIALVDVLNIGLFFSQFRSDTSSTAFIDTRRVRTSHANVL